MCKKEGQKEGNEQGKLGSVRGARREPETACPCQALSLSSSILCRCHSPMLPPRNQDTFYNYNLGMEWEGHTGLSQLLEEKHIFLGNRNYLKTTSKQKSCFMSLAISNICISIRPIYLFDPVSLSVYPSFHISICLSLFICLSTYLLLPSVVHQHFLFLSWFRIPHRGAELIKVAQAAFQHHGQHHRTGSLPNTFMWLNLSSDHRFSDTAPKGGKKSVTLFLRVQEEKGERN